LPLSNNEGVDASYRFNTSTLTNTIQVYSGRKDFDTEVSGSARKVLGIFDTTEFGDVTLHGGYHQATITLEAAQPFFDLFKGFGQTGAAIADRYELDDTKISLWTVGGSYDPGAWFVRSEFSRSTSKSFIGTLRGWYVTSGYRLAAFTPYAGFAQSRKLANTSDPGLDVSSLPPALQGFAFGLNAGLDAFLKPNDYDTWTLGTRWDFAESVALKLQLDHMRLDAGSNANLINLQPGYAPGGKVNVFSATIDFVF
jgi:predicted porin